MPVDESTLLSGDANNNDADTTTAAFLYWETTEVLAQNWKQILLIGILNVMTGVGCLLFPIFATQVVETFMAILVFTMGLLTVFASVIQSGQEASSNTSQQQMQQHRQPLFWVGVIQIVLALIMWFNPFLTLTILTFFIAVTFMILGSLQITVARQTQGNMAGRTLMLLSGVLAVLMSIIILLAMPAAQWVTIGVLMGANFVNIGLNRVAMGLYGRKIAQEENVDRWRSFLDADLV